MKFHCTHNGKHMIRFALHAILFALLSLHLAPLAHAAASAGPAPDYTDASNWAFLPGDLHDARAVLFMVAPTVDLGTGGNKNMDMGNAEMRRRFVGSLNMQLGIYDQTAVFAPFYRQASLAAYRDMDAAKDAFDLAYADVRSAFRHFMRQRQGKPFVLAGFSQGAQLVKRLVMEFGADTDFASSFIAAYCIGWRLTADDVARYKHLKPAQGADDTGVMIFFSSEAEGVNDSLFIPGGTRSLAINPLNWRTDATPADKSLNLGARFTDYTGTTVKFVPNHTGAYLDPVRGALKCPDIRKDEYPGAIFPDGVYHIYDYQFFFENLKKNVADRIRAFGHNASKAQQ